MRFFPFSPLASLSFALFCSAAPAPIPRALDALALDRCIVLGTGAVIRVAGQSIGEIGDTLDSGEGVSGLQL